MEWFYPFSLFGRTLVDVLSSALKKQWRVREMLKQSYECAVTSIPIILFSLSVVSVVSVLEFSWHMKLVMKQDALVPAFSMVLILREVAPVVVAMLLTSRVGASIAAELGFMRITDQLDQLKLLGVSEIEYLIIPRWIGSLVATLTLTLLALGITVVVSCFGGAPWMGYQPYEYFNSLFVFARPVDLMGCIVKAICFGTIIPFVAASCGLRCNSGSAGVGKAATQSVVRSTVLIIISDFIINSLIWMK